MKLLASFYTITRLALYQTELLESGLKMGINLRKSKTHGHILCVYMTEDKDCHEFFFWRLASPVSEFIRILKTLQ